MAASIPAVDQQLVLQCTANIVSGTTSIVDIIWTTGNMQVRRVNNVIATSNFNSSSVYRIEGNFGGGKHWRIWQMAINFPKFPQPNFMLP